MARVRKVYRVEDEFGKGVYQNGDAPQNGPRHPAPFEEDESSPIHQWYHRRSDQDFMGHKKKEYFFGFATLKQFRKWFDKRDRNKIIRWNFNAFKLSVYEVEDQYIHIGDTQAIFVLDKAKLIARYDLADEKRERNLLRKYDTTLGIAA